MYHSTNKVKQWSVKDCLQNIECYNDYVSLNIQVVGNHYVFISTPNGKSFQNKQMKKTNNNAVNLTQSDTTRSKDWYHTQGNHFVSKLLKDCIPWWLKSIEFPESFVLWFLCEVATHE